MYSEEAFFGLFDKMGLKDRMILDCVILKRTFETVTGFELHLRIWMQMSHMYNKNEVSRSRHYKNEDAS